MSDFAVIIGAVAAILGINAWKRELLWRKHSDLAEKALLSVYEMQSAINSIRSPFSSSAEYEGRERVEGESQHEKSARDRAYVVFARLDKHSEVYGEMRTIQQRCRVMFGDSYTKIFDDLWGIIVNIMVTTEILGDHYWNEPLAFYEKEERKRLLADRRELEAVIWYRGNQDKIRPKVEGIVTDAESLFRSKITPPSLKDRFQAACGYRCKCIESK
ncbi:hypothetical protein [Salidesulfovibrio brasiliensis]|uniref:hypothetical protein n=1 Tax=Salidesulfovibrio brasiliensis TaxID=221711 RepID=UPI0012EE3B17|nr:hypothetical protein [Salidesulfovibrio brasiliensis]